MKTPDKRGFTLIELLIVIAIIGILMGLLFPFRKQLNRLVCPPNRTRKFTPKWPGGGSRTLRFFSDFFQICQINL